ncbi:MAG: hypothetical protein ACFFAN_06785 [Promethearchaeota archaeon]
MAIKSEEQIPSSKEKEVEKHEINLQFHWYLLSIFLVYAISFSIPGIIFMLYLLLFFVPYFLGTHNFFSIFTELNPLIALITMPLIIIGCYLLRLLFIALITRILWRITEKKSPSKDGIIPRNIPSKTLDYYHIRSFLIKYPKYIFTKGAFPWLITWLYNFVGSNKIGKGTTIEEQICGDKFIKIGKNCFIGVNSVLTSHLVEGLFGNVIYFKVKLGDNVTMSAFDIIGPGCELGDNCYIFPLASTAKYYVLKGNNYYYGLPLRKIFKKKIKEYLNVSEEDFNRNKELTEKQIQLKNKAKDIK